jgi:hypothetical protein
MKTLPAATSGGRNRLGNLGSEPRRRRARTAKSDVQLPGGNPMFYSLYTHAASCRHGRSELRPTASYYSRGHLVANLNPSPQCPIQPPNPHSPCRVACADNPPHFVGAEGHPKGPQVAPTKSRRCRRAAAIRGSNAELHSPQIIYKCTYSGKASQFIFSRPAICSNRSHPRLALSPQHFAAQNANLAQICGFSCAPVATSTPPHTKIHLLSADSPGI